MGDGTTRFWYCRQNCQSHDWSRRWDETQGNGIHDMQTAFNAPTTAIDVNEVCWLAGQSRDQTLADLVPVVAFTGANGTELYMYGHKESTLLGGRVLIAIVCDGSPLAGGNRSKHLQLLPGSGRTQIDYSVLYNTLQTHHWG